MEEEPFVVSPHAQAQPAPLGKISMESGELSACPTWRLTRKVGFKPRPSGRLWVDKP